MSDVRCQMSEPVGHPKVNRFEQVSSDGYEMSLTGRWVLRFSCLGGCLGPVGVGWGGGRGGGWWGGLYSKVQCIMANSHK